MSTSAKKVATSRINGQKSHGPTNTSSTRFNATKHGLLTAGITELDDAEGYQTILRDLTREKNPVGATETYLVKAAALDMVRWLRARRLEAEYITSELNPPLHSPDPLLDLDLVFQRQMLDPGLPAAINAESGQRLVNIFQRYETNIANRLFRTLHELERLQRMRQGESLPAPATVDVNVHTATRMVNPVPVVPAETSIVDSVPAALGQLKAVPSDEESLPMPATVNVNVHADTGMLDSVPTALEQPKALPDHEE
jgi:hypothetical protein